MSRQFVHARTGRTVSVADGSRTERLVQADSNWSEVRTEPKRAPAKRPASKPDQGDE